MEAAVQKLASILEQAQAIGREHASNGKQERALAWGGKFVNLLQSAWDIVNTFVQRIVDWINDQDVEDITQDDIDTEVATLADHVGSFEVAAAIEQEIVDILQAQGVSMMVSVAQPDACAGCLAKADADPVPIDQFVPPPYHGRCRCSSASGDEE